MHDSHFFTYNSLISCDKIFFRLCIAAASRRAIVDCWHRKIDATDPCVRLLMYLMEIMADKSSGRSWIASMISGMWADESAI